MKLKIPKPRNPDTINEEFASQGLTVISRTRSNAWDYWIIEIAEDVDDTKLLQLEKHLEGKRNKIEKL